MKAIVLRWWAISTSIESLGETCLAVAYVRIEPCQSPVYPPQSGDASRLDGGETHVVGQRPQQVLLDLHRKSGMAIGQ